MIKCIISLIFHRGGFWETGAIRMGFSGYNEESLKGQEVITAESPLEDGILAADVLCNSYATLRGIGESRRDGSLLVQVELPKQRLHSTLRETRFSKRVIFFPLYWISYPPWKEAWTIFDAMSKVCSNPLHPADRRSTMAQTYSDLSTRLESACMIIL
ncbi:hypothetical protein ARMSODRAFT_1088820 [Armillaria solidipes]|uniref:Uncharacterized protein n=1 Tax=Armillaria solidipes TaxID=1076256 RepID=A0A2H3AWE9_9AGAR|nr:hypothetical protein ARMSODRAFT_1088820 [Armillaria solidipes]